MHGWQSEQPAPQGESLTPQLLWTLSKLWYHDRLSLAYRSRTAAQVTEIFQALELTSPFWRTDGAMDAPQK